MSKRKLKIAVTGGIGSGKSEFCRILQSKGYPVIVADDISKTILANDSTVKAKIIKGFGKESFQEDRVNTKYLADIVFSDPVKLTKINSILHPFVLKKIEEEMKSYLQKNDFVFVEAALIYEVEMEDMFDYVVLIFTDEQTRIKRVLEQKKLSEEEIKKRINNQISDEEKKHWADFVFTNNEDVTTLEAKVEFLINLLNSMEKK